MIVTLSKYPFKQVVEESVEQMSRGRRDGNYEDVRRIDPTMLLQVVALISRVAKKNYLPKGAPEYKTTRVLAVFKEGEG